MAAEKENLELKKIAKEAKEPSEYKRLLSKEGDEKKVKKVKGASKANRVEHAEGLQRSMSSPAPSTLRQQSIQSRCSETIKSVNLECNCVLMLCYLK